MFMSTFWKCSWKPNDQAIHPESHPECKLSFADLYDEIKKAKVSQLQFYLFISRYKSWQLNNWRGRSVLPGLWLWSDGPFLTWHRGEFSHLPTRCQYITLNNFWPACGCLSLLTRDKWYKLVMLYERLTVPFIMKGKKGWVQFRKV